MPIPWSTMQYKKKNKAGLCALTWNDIEELVNSKSKVLTGMHSELSVKNKNINYIVWPCEEKGGF